jgi:hypothetical protein
MRQDLMKFVPEVSGNQRLMCCACGRFLPQEFFDLDHLIPQQALKDDPNAVRTNPATPANTRAGNTALQEAPEGQRRRGVWQRLQQLEGPVLRQGNQPIDIGDGIPGQELHRRSHHCRTQSSVSRYGGGVRLCRRADA